MKYLVKELNNWAIEKIKKEYKDDVALLIGHEHSKIAPDGNDIVFDFFIPCTERGFQLAKTFIIDGIGYDLYPMTWERAEGIADIKEELTRCIADGVVLYARTEEDKNKFLALKEKLQERLKDEKTSYMRALEKVNTSMELFKNMMFEKSISKIRMTAGFIGDYLAQAILTVNGTYAKRGSENMIATIEKLEKKPEGFIKLYEKCIHSTSIEENRVVCHEMLQVVREFFVEMTSKEEKQDREYNYKEVAEWYQEIIYWFRRLYYYCDTKNAENAYGWACWLQTELNFISSDYGTKNFDLMMKFDADNLQLVKEEGKNIEQYIIDLLEEHDVKLVQYSNFEEFIKEN